MYLGLVEEIAEGIQGKLYDAAREATTYFNSNQSKWPPDVRQVFSSRLDSLNIQSINPDLDVADLAYLMEDYESLLAEMESTPKNYTEPSPVQPPKEIPSIPGVPGVTQQPPLQAGIDPILLLGIAGLAYLVLKEKR